jgi:DNA-directed RNA polymerase
LSGIPLLWPTYVGNYCRSAGEKRRRKNQDKLSKSDINEFKDIKLSRKMIKRSVMTIPYYISMSGIGVHLMEHLEENWIFKERFVKIPGIATISGNDLILNGSQYGKLCKIIYFVLTKELPSLRLLPLLWLKQALQLLPEAQKRGRQESNYFNSMIDIFAKLNLPITWLTPSGLKVSYTTIKFESIKIKANLLSKSKTTTIKLPTDSIDKLAMKRSFMPNFIHSLDAANIHLLLANISELNIPIYTLHDCFATTPNYMFTMEKLVKEAFINIYFKDQGYLIKLHKLFFD